MSPISWPQWFPAFERSQKRITECHNLIMYFRVSLHVLRLLEILHPHYDLALCLLPVSLFCFTLPFLMCFRFLSTLISISSLFLVSNFSIPRFSFAPFCLVFHPFCAPFLYLRLSSPPLWFIPPLLHSFTWTGGGAAGLLRPCVRDGNHRGDVWCGGTVWLSAGQPHPVLSRMTCLHAPLVAFSTYWEKSIKDNCTTNMFRYLISLTGGYLSGRERDSSPSNNTKLGSSSKKKKTSSRL